MNRKLTDAQIEALCRELVAVQRRVGVRTIMAELRRRHGASGRTARVAQILRRAEQSISVVPAAGEGRAALLTMAERLRQAEVRAARAEELERRHQDYWARRYAEKADELERKYAAVLKSRPAITSDEYLRLHQRVAELSRRLARYEPVER